MTHQGPYWTGLPRGRSGRAINSQGGYKQNNVGRRRRTRDTLTEETGIGNEKVAALYCRENDEAKGMC
jgi:hypothetical protein